MKLKKRLKNLPKYKIKGRVTGIAGPVIEAALPKVSIGDCCVLENGMETEVVGFKSNTTLLMAYDNTRGIRVGSLVEAKLEPVSIGVGDALLGSVIDPFGQPLNKESLAYSQAYYVNTDPVNPLLRERIVVPLDMGVRSVNALLPIGKGQRVGIFAGAGVGKSTLLGMMSRDAGADVNVIALIGERGREVREFIEDNLKEEGLAKSVIVTATSDQTPLAKIRAVYTATTIAGYFSAQGRDVLFLVDSLTRLAMAQREIGLAVGEPPTSKGYTPSVFSMMPRIIEQAGNFSGRGSITGLYTVLVEGDEIASDPVADAAVGFLDGHILLSRSMAQKNIYPAIDVLKSVSRLGPQLSSDKVKAEQNLFMELEALYREAEDMINLGLYKKGTTPLIDLAIDERKRRENFLRQPVDLKCPIADSLQELENMIQYVKLTGEADYGIEWSQ